LGAGVYNLRVKLYRRTLSGVIFKYIVKEAIFSFLVTFAFFFFIFFVNQLLLMAQNILTKRVPVQQVALLIFYSLPSIISMSAPFAVLVGTLMTIGRLSSDNEAMAMLSAGLSYANIFLPAIVMGVLISGLSFMINDMLLPLGTLEFTKLYRRIVFSTPALELESNSVKRFRDTVLITGNVENKSIDDVMILDRTAEGERRLIMAKRAELKESDTMIFSLDLAGAFVHSAKENNRSDYDYASASSLHYSLTGEDFIQGTTSLSPREMSSLDVYREIRVKEAKLDERIAEQKAKAASQGMLLERALRRGPEGASDWNQRNSWLDAYRAETTNIQFLKKDGSLLGYKIEFYKKFSLPLGGFAFIFLAFPIGLLARKSGQTVGFLIGLLIAVAYWALVFGGQTLGMRLGYSPFWCMWLPDMLASGIGIVLCIYRIRQ
jgi:lipopolysaccharide export system permease protein